MRLADAIDLALQARRAHRHVKGPQLAARPTAFGGTAEGTAQVVAKRRSLEPYPLAIGAAHREALAAALATFARRAREAIGTAAGPGDPVTADRFSGIAGAIDRPRWLVAAQRQAER